MKGRGPPAWVMWASVSYATFVATWCLMHHLAPAVPTPGELLAVIVRP